MDAVKLYEGGLAVDDRGRLSFVNDFDFRDVKRFYMIENCSTNVIRAFHGHLKEGKYFFVARGSAIVAAVHLDNVESPSRKAEIRRFVLSDRKPAILYVPPHHANGLKALEAGTQIVVYSTSTLQESKNDDYRFPHDYWGMDVWEVTHR
ncbi:MAG: sugar epimerase [Planctomycetes bacterium RBG_16_59_8]|nr:MAG: sugar epimerase [Planctomycetes bacterium RBG_16_59_8]